MNNRCDGGAKVSLPRQGLIDPLSKPLSSKTRASSPTSSQHDTDDFLVASTSSLPDPDAQEQRSAHTWVPDTPPTPQPSNLPSPNPDTAFALVDPQIVAEARQQSDRASSAIGQKLLKGWTLLGDECTNPECHHIPLMRRPKVIVEAHSASGLTVANGKRPASHVPNSQRLLDPRRYCVICQRDSVREQDTQALHAFLAATAPSSSTSSTVAPTAALAEPALSRGDPAGDQDIVHTSAAKKRRFAMPASGATLRSVKPAVPRQSLSVIGSTGAPTSSVLQSSPQDACDVQNGQVMQKPALRAAKASLEKAVTNLAQRLDRLCEADGVDSSGSHFAAVAAAAEHLATTCRSLDVVIKLL